MQAINERVLEAFRRGRIAYVNNHYDFPPHEIDTAEFWAWSAGWNITKAEEFAFCEDYPETEEQGDYLPGDVTEIPAKYLH